MDVLNKARYFLNKIYKNNMMENEFITDEQFQKNRRYILKNEKINIINIRKIKNLTFDEIDFFDYILLIDSNVEISDDFEKHLTMVDISKIKNNDVTFFKNNFFSKNSEKDDWQMYPFVSRNFLLKQIDKIKDSECLTELNLKLIANENTIFSYHYFLEKLFFYNESTKYEGELFFNFKYVNSYVISVKNAYPEISIEFNEKLLFVMTTFNLTAYEFEYWKKIMSESRIKLFIVHDNMENYNDTKKQFEGMPFAEMHFNYSNDYRLLSFLKFLEDSKFEFLDESFYIKIIDPDDFINLKNANKISNEIKRLNNSYSGIIHSGTKVKNFEKWSKVLRHLPSLAKFVSTDPKWQSTFGNFQLIYNVKNILNFYKKNKYFIPKIKYHDDRFLSFLMINEGKLFKINLNFYIQFHAKGQTNDEKIIDHSYSSTPNSDLEKIYNFFLTDKNFIIPNQTNEISNLHKKNYINNSKRDLYRDIMIKKSIWNWVDYEGESKVLTIVTTLAKNDKKTVESFLENLESISKSESYKYIDFILIYRNDDENYTNLIKNKRNLFKKIIEIKDVNTKKNDKLMLVREFVKTKYVKFNDPDDFLISEGLKKLVKFLIKNDYHYITAMATMVQKGSESKYLLPGTNAVSVFRTDVYKTYDENAVWKYDELFYEDAHRFMSWLIYFCWKNNEKIRFGEFLKSSSLKCIINDDEDDSSEYFIRAKKGHIFNFESKEWENAYKALESLSKLISKLNFKIDFNDERNLVNEKLIDLIRMVCMSMIYKNIKIDSNDLSPDLINLIKEYLTYKNINFDDFKKIVNENNRNLIKYINEKI